MISAFDQYPHERRRSPRVDGADIEVEYYSSGREASPAKTKVKNICLHGICLCMPAISKEWKTIHLNIRLPKSDSPIHVEGSVVWYNMLEGDNFYSVGIEFNEISDEERKLIENYVEAKLKE